MSTACDTSVMTVSSALAAAAHRLRQAGVDAPRLDARLLLAHVLECGQAELVRDATRELADFETRNYAGLTARREAREPVSRIIGQREFWSLEFEIDPHTLDPRADSECVIEAALDMLPDRSYPLRVLDLGTGSGCLLIALLREYPGATGVAVDCSSDALLVAARNAARLGVSERIRFVHADMTAANWNDRAGGLFDLLVCNPPYIPDAEIDGLAPEVARFDPRAALSGGPDGLDFYLPITNVLDNVMAQSGYALFEVGAGQQRAVADLLRERGFCLHPPRRDMNGIDRVVVAQMSGP